MTNKTFEELLAGYVSGKLTQEELGQFLKLVREKKYESGLEQEIDKMVQDKSVSGLSDAKRSGPVFEKIMASAREKKTGREKVIHLSRSKLLFVRNIAAALVLLLVGAGVLFLPKRRAEKPVVKLNPQPAKYKNDVAPGGDKAMLTLADGSTILLDNAQEDTLVSQGNTKVINLGGKLAYKASGEPAGEVVYHTLSTPAGGQYKVQLPDGSEVWLNASSSLRFPTSFTGPVRKVEIKGEAYFEIAKNKAMPFVVSVNGAEVRVLGTHFNVMAYDDEAAVQTTLLEGSVKFVSAKGADVLRPGQQLHWNYSGEKTLLSNVDVDDVVAWKNGSFRFEEADIKTIMRQVARWYDVEVVYQNKSINGIFFFEMPRTSKLSDVLKVLELTGKIRFQIDGRTVTVKQ